MNMQEAYLIIRNAKLSRDDLRELTISLLNDVNQGLEYPYIDWRLPHNTKAQDFIIPANRATAQEIKQVAQPKKRLKRFNHIGWIP